ncbi:Hypothetical protein PENO1_081070 [Penicillium occitanis (nom. inval.)]|nr:Hypothetical protein PENO1_081070 [Penicillium occitanis (nom. inval.)]PCG98719.1 hypothetical protein PENOC_061780 [Penicillium occitanis (nom. inval.)]
MKINGLAVQATTGVFRDSGLDETKMSTMWPVEFYSAEFLTDHPLSLVRLRCNMDTAKQKNSFGDDMAIVHRSWNVITTEARRAILSSQKSFVDFLNGILPSNTAVTTWLPLLNHDGWQEWIQTIISFTWGRATLVASQLTTAFACHHPKPFFDLFAKDMAYLIVKPKIFTTLTLRPLLFPVWPDDFAFTTRAKDKTVPDFPSLATPFTFNENAYSKLRPDFLTRLTDDGHTKLFSKLRTLSESAPFPNWNRVMRDDTQHTAHDFPNVMKHVVSWINPNAKLPASRSENAINWTWEEIVQTHLMPRRDLPTVFRPSAENRNNLTLCSNEFVDGIWKHCSTYAHDFLVDLSTPALSVDSQEVVTQQRAKDYMHRLTFPVWNTILQATFDYHGAAFSKETFMKHFNDPSRIGEARLPWTIWGSTTEYANFVHNSELRRLPMIRNSFVRHGLNREAALMGALFGYRHLKTVWLAHMRAADTAGNTDGEVLSEDDLPLVKAALAQYAEYLNSTKIYEVRPFNIEGVTF